jgi:hypothetical protein
VLIAIIKWGFIDGDYFQLVRMEEGRLMKARTRPPWGETGVLGVAMLVQVIIGRALPELVVMVERMLVLALPGGDRHRALGIRG